MSEKSLVKSFLKNSGIYTFGQMAGSLVGFLMLPIYTRYLTPADYGVVGLMIFTLAIIEGLFGARLAHALPKFYYDKNNIKDSHAVVSTALVITAVISSLVMLVTISARESIAIHIFDSLSYSTVVGLFSILILTQAIEAYGLTFIRIKEKAVLFVSLSLTKLVIQLSLNIYFIVLEGLGVLGIALSSAISSMFFASILGAYTVLKTGLKINFLDGRKMIVFCWPLWLAGVASVYISSSNRYFIKEFSSMDEVGLFELALKFATILALLVWEPFYKFWEPESFRLHKAGQHDSYRYVFKGLSTLLLLVATGIAMFADNVIQIMADESFHSAGNAIVWLCLALLFSSLTEFCHFSLFISDRTRWVMHSSYILAIIVTAYYFLLIPDFGFVGASIAFMLAYLTRFIMVYQIGKRYFDMNLDISSLAIGIVIAAASYVTTLHIDNSNLIIETSLELLVFITLALALIALQLNDKVIRQYIVERASDYRKKSLREN